MVTSTRQIWSVTGFRFHPRSLRADMAMAENRTSVCGVEQEVLLKNMRSGVKVEPGFRLMFGFQYECAHWAVDNHNALGHFFADGLRHRPSSATVNNCRPGVVTSNRC